MLAIGSQRHLFDIPEGVAYFNAAYQSPLLNASRERLAVSVAAKRHPWNRPASDFFDDAEQMRVLAADIFGGDATDGIRRDPGGQLRPQHRRADAISADAGGRATSSSCWRRNSPPTSCRGVAWPPRTGR